MYFDAEKFGERLAQLRNERNKMTQDVLAEELHISQEHLSKMERGKRSPSLDLIIDIADYFQVSSDYLLLGKVRDTNGEQLLEMAAKLTEMARNL